MERLHNGILHDNKKPNSCHMQQHGWISQSNVKWKKPRQGFPGGSVIKNLPANAGDAGFIPDLGRSHKLWSNKAHELQLLNLCSRAREPQLLNPCAPELVLCNNRSPCNEVCAPQLESSPHLLQLEQSSLSLLQLEKSPCSSKIQHSQK